MRAKVLIVGGGVVGTAAALYAAQNRDPIAEPVVLLEKSDLASGASGRSGGVVHQQDERRTVAGMARDSLRFYDTFRSRMGRSVGFIRSGVLTLGGAGRREQLAGNVEMLTSIGIHVRLVDAAEIRDLVPGIVVDDDAVGVFEPHGGFLDPAETILSLAALARFHGATTRLGVEVHEIHVDGGRIRGARTTEGEYEADQIVLAAGPWTKRLARDIGVELPLSPVRTEHVYLGLPQVQIDEEPDDQHEDDPWTLEDSAISPRPAELRLDTDAQRIPGLHPVLFDLDGKISIRCDPVHGHVRIGQLDFDRTSALADPDDLDEEVGEASGASLLERAVQLLPRHGELPEVGRQATWCTLTDDGRGLAGPVPGVEGLYVAGGFTNHDFHLAPSLGEGLGQLLRGEPVSAFDPEFFSLDRLGSGS